MEAHCILSRLFSCLCGTIAVICYGVTPLFGRTFQQDVQRCIAETEKHDPLPPIFIDLLIAAEDHRFRIHRGIDPHSIIRAVFACAVKRRIQGASTIEQQFVRVVTGRYERTVARKIREQALAMNVARHCSKEAIACAYLSIATYGTGIMGRSGLMHRYHALQATPLVGAAGMIARLKYPEPLRPSQSWVWKIERRQAHILRRVRRQNGFDSDETSTARCLI